VRDPANEIHSEDKSLSIVFVVLHEGVTGRVGAEGGGGVHCRAMQLHKTMCSQILY